MLRVTLVAIGRLKTGPERELATRYLERAIAAGRSLGLSFEVHEIDESRARRPEDRKREEAKAVGTCLAPGAAVVTLDESGRALDSADFAGLICAARDSARGTFALIIGGPDGLDPVFCKNADHVVAFGSMTWPHQLVRVMAAEQIYRAVTILAGHPYHRS